MSAAYSSSLLGLVGRAGKDPALAGLSDRELLDRHLASRDGQAFLALLARHGPMVLDVCRAMVPNSADAEDAFQATFLVFARSAGRIRKAASLGCWLHGVAFRTSLKAKAQFAARRKHEQKKPVASESIEDDLSWREVRQILHEELNRLPERSRSVLLLCYMQGKTQDEAAALLGVPKGTLKGRLERAKESLRVRLIRRGLGPAALLAAATTAAGAIPPSLLSATTELVSESAAVGLGATNPASILARAVEKTMLLSKLKFSLLAVLVVATVVPAAWQTLGTVRADSPAEAAGPATIVPVSPIAALAAPAPPAKPIPKELQPFQGLWTIGLCDTANETLYASNRELGKWRWTIKGDEITWAFKGEEWKLTFRVDPTKKPKEFDFTYTSGPFKGEKCLGMYDWGGVDSKTLQIAIQDPGATKPRPTELRMSGTSQNALIFLRKIEPIDPEKELAALQGNWTLRLTQSDGWPVPIGKGPDKTGRGSERRWMIKGNEITWTSPDAKEIKASFVIDPTKVPRHFDLTFLSGPDKGAKCQGVYEWLDKGDGLWLCMVDPGSTAIRPKDISYSTGEGRSMIALDRYRAPAGMDGKRSQGAGSLGGSFDVLAAAPVPEPVPTEPRDPVAQIGDHIYAASYSRDGRLLALAQPKTYDGKGEDKVLLFDTRTWKRLHKLAGPKTYCFGVAFSADGTSLFAACNDGLVYSWDTKTGTPGRKLDAGAGHCHRIVLSPDGTVLATGHLDTTKKPPQSSIHLWDAATGKPLRTITSQIPVLANTLAFTPDSRVIAGGYNNRLTGAKDFSGVIEWDVATGKERKRYDAVRITPGAFPITHAISYTRDGKWMLVGGGEAVPDPNFPGSSSLHGYLWLYDRKTGKPAKTLLADRHDYVRMLAQSPDGDRLYLPTNTVPRMVVEKGQTVMKSFGELQCWDTRTWELKWTTESEPTGYWALIASPDGKRIATATGAGFNLFDAMTGEPRGALINTKQP